MAEVCAPKNRIRELRRQKGLTLQGLADAVMGRGRVQMHHTTLTKIENRQRRLTSEFRDEIAAVFGVEPDSLLTPETETVSDRSIPVVPLRSLSNRSGIVGIRIPKAADESMLPRGATAIVDLDDREPGDGWWAAIAGLKVTLLHCDKGVWSDVLKEGNPRVKASVVEPLGRLIEYRVSLVGDTAEAEDEDVDEDIYEAAAVTEHDGKPHRPGFLEKASK